VGAEQVIDLGALLRESLSEYRKESDGFLHPSTHLDGNLRHAWLDQRKYPHTPDSLGREARTTTGTWWHEYIAGVMRAKGLPFMSEVNLRGWLPPGWSGTMDCLLYLPSDKLWLPWDYKTKDDLTKAQEWGLSLEYSKQLSAYGGAVQNMGLRVTDYGEVKYIPIAGDHSDIVSYTVNISDTLSVWDEMKRVSAAVAEGTDIPPIPSDNIHYRKLQSGVVKVYWQHHMSRMWCSFQPDVCGCKVDDVKWHALCEIKIGDVITGAMNDLCDSPHFDLIDWSRVERMVKGGTQK
jgi:hypothetical protein